jgi:hypothetical protein
MTSRHAVADSETRYRCSVRRSVQDSGDLGTVGAVRLEIEGLHDPLRRVF